MNSIEFAREIRRLSVEMVYKARASHIGGAMSMADILAVLYTGEIKFDAASPEWDGRDRFLLSKGHACVSYYATLSLAGFYPISQLKTYAQKGSPFLCHISHHVPGVEFSAGSLGHGLPIATGIALAAQRQHKDYNTYVLLGDGEMDEGSNWEALLFAAHHHLSNLCAIVDYNKIQSFGDTNKVLNLESLVDKLIDFNCNVIECEGHNHEELKKSFELFKQETEKPTVVVAHTIKGKGVSYMENELAWHYKSPSAEQYQQAMEELAL